LRAGPTAALHTVAIDGMTCGLLRQRPEHVQVVPLPRLKGVAMNRRDILALSAATLVVGCSTTSPSDNADPASRRKEIDAATDAALNELNTSTPGARDLVAKARGVLVFPRVTSAGFIVGGTYGQGALRKGGRSAGYYSVGAGSVGLLAGAQTRSVFLLFMTPEALQKFEASKGWTVGADASVAMIDVGASANINSQTAQSPVIGFVRNQNGLMANLSIDGTKFQKLDL
jgi:lipid-binding SYLF domain-containing protein